MIMIARTIASINKIHPAVWQLICLTISLVLFSLVFLTRSPGFLRPFGIALRTDFWPIVPLTALLVYVIYRIPGRIGELSAFAIVMILFALGLAGLWASGNTQTSTISGLIPMNDARSYYVDALRLTHGTSFSFFSSRRPLFAGFLSVLLLITNFNLAASLAILAAITGISIYFLSRELERTHGTETAVFAVVMMFLYYRLHSGTNMSENLGVALGTLGFSCLWRGAADRKLSLVWLGLLATTLALNARAGAFFVLPFLVFWAGWLFRAAAAVSWKVIGICSTAVVLGFAANLLLTRLIGEPTGIPFANFSFSLYSLAAGGKSWAYIADVHPEVFLIAEPEQTRRIYQLAFELMRERPLLSVQGAYFFWGALFSDSLYNVFSYAARENWTINPIVKWSLYLLSVTGIVACLRDRRSALHSLVLACVLGVFISVPFVPPTDSFRIRPYAASIAIITIVPALGVGYLSHKARLGTFKRMLSDDTLASPSMYFSILALLLISFGPLIIKFSAPKQAFTTVSNCKTEPDQILIRFDRGISINLRKNTMEFLDWLPHYHIYLFRKNAHSLEDANLIEWAGHMPPSQTLLVAVDLAARQDALAVVPTEILPEFGTYVQLCGRYEQDPALARYRIFYAEEVLSVPQ